MWTSIPVSVGKGARSRINLIEFSNSDNLQTSLTCLHPLHCPDQRGGREALPRDGDHLRAADGGQRAGEQLQRPRHQGQHLPGPGYF